MGVRHRNQVSDWKGIDAWDHAYCGHHGLCLIRELDSVLVCRPWGIGPTGDNIDKLNKELGFDRICKLDSDGLKLWPSGDSSSAGGGFIM